MLLKSFINVVFNGVGVVKCTVGGVTLNALSVSFMCLRLVEVTFLKPVDDTDDEPVVSAAVVSVVVLLLFDGPFIIDPFIPVVSNVVIVVVCAIGCGPFGASVISSMILCVVEPVSELAVNADGSVILISTEK